MRQFVRRMLRKRGPRALRIVQRTWLDLVVYASCRCHAYKCLRDHIIDMMRALLSIPLVVAAQPTFPDGAGPVMRSVNARSAAASAAANDDSNQIQNLLQAGEDALVEDSIEQAVISDLEKSAYNAVHMRLRQQVFVAGCPRDFAGCPSTWIESESNKCRPPRDYDGLCSDTDFSAFSVSQKEDFAWKCRANWPCVATCKRNFAQCPEAWTSVGDGVCSAPSSYVGICSSVTDFSAFTEQRKAEWAALCDAEWPCK